jgi:hypothetical protein
LIGRVALIRYSSGDTLIPREEVVNHYYPSDNLRKEDWSHRKLINHLQELPAPDTRTLIGRVLSRLPSDDIHSSKGGSCDPLFRSTIFARNTVLTETLSITFSNYQIRPLIGRVIIKQSSGDTKEEESTLPLISARKMIVLDLSSSIGVVTPLSSHSRRSENGDVAPSP